MPKNTPGRIIDEAAIRSAVAFYGGGGGAGGALPSHNILPDLEVGDAHPHYLNAARGDTRYVPLSRNVAAGEGLAGGGALSGNISLALASSIAGAALAYNAGVLSVVPGEGLELETDAIGLSASVAGAGLTYAAGILSVSTGAGLAVVVDSLALVTPGTLAVSTNNDADGPSNNGQHTHAITSSSNPGAAASLLATDASGYLQLVRLTLSDRLRASLLDTAAAENMTLQPGGDVVLDPTGNDVLPGNAYDINLGTLSKKFLSLHAAELWVETLVAQSTIATIGGRIMVGPTTILTRDLAPAATTIYVKHNQMVSGDRAYMEAGGQLEFFAVTSAGTLQGAGDYAYTVTRNLDGTGTNQWYAGDALFNTGQTGNGFIDLYSISGIPRAGQSGQRAGPTIVGNVRLSATYNDFRERWAVGNLNALYDYGANEYGAAFGNPLASWLGADATNGVRIMQGTTKRTQLDINGNLRFYNSAGNEVIVLDNAGNSFFAGVMSIGTAGEIRQGTGTLGTSYTGLRIWRDTNVGRIAGYSNDLLQWHAGTDGKLYAGGGNVKLDANGVTLPLWAPELVELSGKIKWLVPGTENGYSLYAASGVFVLNVPVPLNTHVLELRTNTNTYKFWSELNLPSPASLTGATFSGAVSVPSFKNTGGAYASDNAHAFTTANGSAYQAVVALSFAGTNLGLSGGIYANNPLGFRTDGGAGQRIWVDALLTSNNYSGHNSRVPANGIYSLGPVAIATSDGAGSGYNLDVSGDARVRGSAIMPLLRLTTTTAPTAVAGQAIMWFDGTNIKVTLSGSTKTLSWT
jgi:hypothetical protein